MKLEKVFYRAEVDSVGGRNGTSVSTDGHLNVKLSVPKEMGGAGGEGTNPEQMFAAGYSACFLGAMQFVAGQKKISLSPQTNIHAVIGIGPVPGGFGLEAELKVTIPGMEKAAAQELVEAAHKVCPYSNATRGNIEVKLTVL